MRRSFLRESETLFEQQYQNIYNLYKLESESHSLQETLIELIAREKVKTKRENKINAAKIFVYL